MSLCVLVCMHTCTHACMGMYVTARMSSSLQRDECEDLLFLR